MASLWPRRPGPASAVSTAPREPSHRLDRAIFRFRAQEVSPKLGLAADLTDRVAQGLAQGEPWTRWWSELPRVLQQPEPLRQRELSDQGRVAAARRLATRTRTGPRVGQLDSSGRLNTVPFTLHDLTDETTSHLFAADTAETYRAWAKAQGDDLLAGLAALGLFEEAGLFEKDFAVVGKHRDKIRDFVAKRDWYDRVQRGLQAAAIAINQPGPEVRVFVLVGTGRSNASATLWNGRGLAFIWLENWLGGTSTGELQDCDVLALEAPVCHELAHAMRHCLPGTNSQLAAAQLRRPRDVWQAQTALSLREVMYDEGLAVRFALDAVPGTSLEDALFMDRDQIAWLEQNWTSLIADRRVNGALDAPVPSPEARADALYIDKDRRKPPWTSCGRHPGGDTSSA